jgi:hypothetical protein
LQRLEKIAGAIIVYEEGHTGFSIPTSYLTICKSAYCRNAWYNEATVIDYQLSERIRQTRHKLSPLLHYDGSTHSSYQVTPRAWEEAYCLRSPQPYECGYRNIDLTKDLFDFHCQNSQDDNFVTVYNIDDKGVERTIVRANKVIPKGSYIMPTDVAGSFTITKVTVDKLQSLNAYIDDATVVEKFLDYVNTHGHESILKGRALRYVDVGASTAIRRTTNMDEANVSHWMPTNEEKLPAYSPVYERHFDSLSLFLVSTRDIRIGEEIVKF